MKSSFRSAVVSGMAALAVLGVTACSATAPADHDKPGSSASAASGATQSQAPTPTTDPVVFTTTPAADAEDVAVDTRVTASAQKGTLTKASLFYTSKKGNRIPVDGTLEGGTWTAGDLLEPGVTYTLTMEATDADGKTTRDDQDVPHREPHPGRAGGRRGLAA